METEKAMVAKIRPVSWKVCVAGEECTQYVRKILYEAGLDCSSPIREPDLQEPPLFSFIATPKAETPFTAPELQAVLNQDSNIDVAFEV